MSSLKDVSPGDVVRVKDSFGALALGGTKNRQVLDEEPPIFLDIRGQELVVEEPFGDLPFHGEYFFTRGNRSGVLRGHKGLAALFSDSNTTTPGGLDNTQQSGQDVLQKMGGANALEKYRFIVRLEDLELVCSAPVGPGGG